MTDAVKTGSKPAKKSDVQPGSKPDEEPDVRPAEPDGEAGEVSCAISMHLLDAQSISWAPQGGTAPMELNDCQPVTSFEIGNQEKEQPAAMPGDQQEEQPDAKPEETSVQEILCGVKPGSKPAEKPEIQPGPKPDEESDGPAEPDGGVAAAGDVSCAISMHSLDAQTISWAPQGGIAPMELNDCQPVTPRSFEIGDSCEGQPAAKPGDQQEAKPDAHPGAKQRIGVVFEITISSYMHHFREYLPLVLGRIIPDGRKVSTPQRYF